MLVNQIERVKEMGKADAPGLTVLFTMATGLITNDTVQVSLKCQMDILTKEVGRMTLNADRARKQILKVISQSPLGKMVSEMGLVLTRSKMGFLRKSYTMKE